MKKKILFGISIVFLIGAALLAPLAFGFGKSGRETKILNKDYSLLSKKEIMAKLEQDFSMEAKVKLVDGERTFFVDLASISAKINRDQTASNLLFRRIGQGLGKYIKAFYENKEFELSIDYDQEKLKEAVGVIAEQIDKPFIPAEINLNSKLEVKEGQLGKETEKAMLEEIIIKKISNYDLENEEKIPVRIVGALPNEEQKAAGLKEAEKLLGKGVELKGEADSIMVDEKTLISWVNFTGGGQESKISDFVNSLATSYKKEAQDAVFRFEEGKVVEFRAAQEGYSVDGEKLKNEIYRSFPEWVNSEAKNISMEMPLVKVQAKISTAEVNNLGIKELLGKGSSSFKHSSNNRNFNVERGASIVNRILVAPGETFSFLKNLGEVTLENGYRKEYVIRQGKTELDVGGGICQVSTTLFRAVLDSGLNITQRQAHAYRVHYYEEDSRPGFDATVFIPSPDLKFVNDTGSYLLIQSKYDGVNKKLTYEIYGTSDGRKTVISNYKQWDASPAPPDVWVDDPTLPTGKVVKDESAVPGLKTAFDWTVTRNGEIIHQKTFTSSYTPWAAVYRRGTGI